MFGAGVHGRQEKEDEIDRLPVDRLVIDGLRKTREQAVDAAEVFELAVRDRNTLAEAAYNASGQKDKSLFQQAGVFRFGINFDTTGVDYPYRWAIGRQKDLEKRLIDGQEQWYLLPNHRSEVSGCIIFGREAVSTVLPLTDTIWWGGLIHESVEIVNDSVDRITVRAER